MLPLSESFDTQPLADTLTAPSSLVSKISGFSVTISTEVQPWGRRRITGGQLEDLIHWLL
jgi:hypothetical protein